MGVPMVLADFKPQNIEQEISNAEDMVNNERSYAKEVSWKNKKNT
jgi:hypothetical protein